MIVKICDVLECNNDDQNEIIYDFNDTYDIAEFLERHFIEPTDENIEKIINLVKENYESKQWEFEHICEKCLLFLLEGIDEF
jgi:hypothetical protein